MVAAVVYCGSAVTFGRSVRTVWAGVVTCGLSVVMVTAGCVALVVAGVVSGAVVSSFGISGSLISSGSAVEMTIAVSLLIGASSVSYRISTVYLFSISCPSPPMSVRSMSCALLEQPPTNNAVAEIIMAAVTSLSIVCFIFRSSLV